MGDIFETPKIFHLVHFVSGDLKLSRGIALEFWRKFGYIEKLKQQHPKKIEVAYYKLMITSYFKFGNKSKMLAEANSSRYV